MRICALMIVMTCALFSCGCQTEEKTQQPLPGVSMNPHYEGEGLPEGHPLRMDTVDPFTGQPWIIRTAQEQKDVSARCARTLATMATQYAEILESCNIVVEDYSGGNTKELTIQGRLHVIRAEDRRRASRLRLSQGNKPVKLEPFAIDQSALDLQVNGTEGVSGQVMLTTQPDPDNPLPDTEEIAIGEIVLYIAKK